MWVEFVRLKHDELILIASCIIFIRFRTDYYCLHDCKATCQDRVQD